MKSLPLRLYLKLRLRVLKGFGTWQWRRLFFYQACGHGGAPGLCTLVNIRIVSTTNSLPRRHQRSKGSALTSSRDDDRYDRQASLHIAVLQVVGVRVKLPLVTMCDMFSLHNDK